MRGPVFSNFYEGSGFQRGQVRVRFIRDSGRMEGLNKLGQDTQVPMRKPLSRREAVDNCRRKGSSGQKKGNRIKN